MEVYLPDDDAKLGRDHHTRRTIRERLWTGCEIHCLYGGFMDWTVVEGDLWCFCAMKGQSRRAYNRMATPWVIMNWKVHFALKGQKQDLRL